MTIELQQNWFNVIHTLFFQLIEGLIAKLLFPNMAQFTSEEKESYRILGYLIIIYNSILIITVIYNTEFIYTLGFFYETFFRFS